MLRTSLVQQIVAEGAMRVEEARKKWNAGHNTVLDWIRRGRTRRSDGETIRLEAFKGPDGGYRVSDGCYVRFLEKLNGGEE